MTLTAAEIWRKYEVPGVPASGAHRPDKADIVAWGTFLETLSNVGAGLAYGSLAQLAVDLAHAANSFAIVYADTTPANNGMYVKIGASGVGSWARAGDLPTSVVQIVVTGGTGNTIVATALETPQVPGAKLYLMNPAANNSGATTINLNGQGALPIKTALGSDLVAGSLFANSPVLMAWAVDHYQLLVSVPVDASGILNDAVAARDAASGYATAAASSASALANQVHQYDTRTLAAAATIPGGVNYVRTLAYASVGDGGGALYKRFAGTPAITAYGNFQSADGAWWVLAEPERNVCAFGAKGDDTTDDHTAFQHAVDYCGTTVLIAGLPVGTVYAPPGRKWKFAGTLTLAAPIRLRFFGAIHYTPSTGYAIRVGTSAAWNAFYDIEIEAGYGDGAASPVSIDPAGNALMLITSMTRSRVKVGSASGFSLGAYDLNGFGDLGYQQVIQHNEFFLNDVPNNGYGIRMKSLDATTSSVQANRFFITSIYQNVTNILMDDSTHSASTSNEFFILSMDNAQSIGVDCYGSLNYFKINFTGAPGTSVRFRDNSTGNECDFGNNFETDIVVNDTGKNNRIKTAPPSQGQLPAAGVAVADNTTYTNNYGVPVMIYVPLLLQSGASVQLAIGPDAAAMQTVGVYAGTSSAIEVTASFRVPAGGKWKFVKTAGTMTYGTAAIQDAG